MPLINKRIYIIYGKKIKLYINNFFPYVLMFLVVSGTECSRNLTALSGLIQTPGFPDNYPNNLECTFIIFAPKMSEIVLEFESFDMEPDNTGPAGASCRFDYLEIWDGYPTGRKRKRMRETDR